VNWLKYDLGVHKDLQGKGFGKFLGRWTGRAFLGASAYMGWREGGLVGAAGAVMEHGAITYAMGAGFKALGLSTAALDLALPLTVAAAGIGLDIHAAMGGRTEDLTNLWVNRYMKKHATLELSTPVVDNFGVAATMRQRSLAAIQNSRLNGRTALGNEAALTYKPYYF
jgi:hypothetical protein